MICRKTLSFISSGTVLLVKYSLFSLFKMKSMSKVSILWINYTKGRESIESNIYCIDIIEA